jgi:hypothetical protein
MNARFLAAVMGTALACIAPCAHAARPLVTEDSDALARGDCEAEAYAARITSSGAEPLRAGVAQWGCGVGASTQLAAAYGRTHQAELKSQVVTLSGKTQFQVRGDDAPGLALAYCLSGSRDEGESFRTESTALTLAGSWSLGGAGLLHGNLGWNHNRFTGRSATTWAAAAEAGIAPGTDLVGEVYGDDRTRPWANAGVRWAASATWSLNASYGVLLETPRIKLITVGAKLAF